MSSPELNPFVKTDSCSSCPEGTDTTKPNDETSCLPNTCTCSNGTPTVSEGSGGTLCEADSTVDCSACNVGYSLSAVYSQVESDSCASVSGRVGITDKATCETAAGNLGLSDTTAYEFSSPYYDSPGCSWHSGGFGGPLKYNTKSSTTRSCSSSQSCLCLHAAAVGLQNCSANSCVATQVQNSDKSATKSIAGKLYLYLLSLCFCLILVLLTFIFCIFY